VAARFRGGKGEIISPLRLAGEGHRPRTALNLAFGVAASASLRRCEESVRSASAVREAMRL
jgi:hypothetical protein